MAPGKPRSCAACNHQGKKCGDNCALAPYFPANMNVEFSAVHKVFGVNNSKKLLNNVPPDSRQETANSLIWEAMAWKDDPIEGPRGLFNIIEAQLDEVRRQIAQISVIKCMGEQSSSVSNQGFNFGNFGQEQRIGGYNSRAEIVPNFVQNPIGNGKELKRNEVQGNYQQQYYSLNPNHVMYEGLASQPMQQQHSVKKTPNTNSLIAVVDSRCHNFDHNKDTPRTKEIVQYKGQLQRWVPPPPGSLKINVGSSLEASPAGPTAAGICRDPLGKWVFGFTFPLSHSLAIGPQFCAIIKPLRESWARCYRSIVMESDSLAILNSLVEFLRHGHVLYLVQKLIKEISEQGWKCRVESVSKEANECANWLASTCAYDLKSTGYNYFEVPPNSIVEILKKDLDGI